MQKKISNQKNKILIPLFVLTMTPVKKREKQIEFFFTSSVSIKRGG